MLKILTSGLLLFGCIGFIYAIQLNRTRDETQPLEWIVYQSDDDGDFDIYRVTPKGTARRSLTNNDSDDLRPAWMPDEELIFYIGSESNYLFASMVSVDGEYLGETNEQMPSSANAYFFAPHDRTKGVSVGEINGNVELYYVDYETNTRQQITELNTVIWNVNWSPDSRWIYFLADEDNDDSNIYRVSPDGEQLQQLTDLPSREMHARLAETGDKIVFASRLNSNWNIYVLDIESRDVQRVTPSSRDDMFPIWVPARTFSLSTMIYVVPSICVLLMIIISVVSYFLHLNNRVRVN